MWGHFNSSDNIIFFFMNLFNMCNDLLSLYCDKLYIFWHADLLTLVGVVVIYLSDLYHGRRISMQPTSNNG